MTDKVLLFGKDKLKEFYPEKHKLLLDLWQDLVDRLQLNPEPSLTFYKRVKTEYAYKVYKKRINREIYKRLNLNYKDLSEMKQGQTGVYIETLEGTQGIYIDVDQDYSQFIMTIAHELWHRYQRQEGKDFQSEPDAEEFARSVLFKFNHSRYNDGDFKSMSLGIEEIKESWWQ